MVEMRSVRAMVETHRVYRVDRRIPEGNAGVTLDLIDEHAGPPMGVQPGQFVMVWLPHIEERPFSVVDVGVDGGGRHTLTLTIAAIGPFTEALCALRPGDRLWIRGSYGSGYTLIGERHLLIGGGSGAASLYLLARSAAELGHTLTVVLGARSASQLMLVERFRALSGDGPVAAHSQVAVELATDDGSAGFHGTALGAAQAVVGSPTFENCDSVYACGPEVMLRAVCAAAAEHRVPCQVSLERAMKCGLGVCGACHCGDRLICYDGPVFSCDVVTSLWEQETNCGHVADE
jgi:dihydroorotate dehydrogenase electron transfer subunit